MPQNKTAPDAMPSLPERMKLKSKLWIHQLFTYESKKKQKSDLTENLLGGECISCYTPVSVDTSMLVTFTILSTDFYYANNIKLYYL